MKKSIPKTSLNSIHSRLSKLTLLVILLLGVNVTYGQVDCNTTMACNDGVQVSLDEFCEVEILPDMVLEGPAYDDSEYTVMVMMPNGNIVPNATVNNNHIGMTLEVSVTLTDCGNSCWGHIVVEDKLPPVIVDCRDYEVNCEDDTDPGDGVIPFPTATDACGPVTDFQYSDEETTLPCSNDYVKTIIRRWTVKDMQGNEATCTQTINVLRAGLDDIVWPPDYDNRDEDAFYCGDILDFLPSGALSPDQTMYPSGASCSNIQTYYEDVIFEICGASKKILRRWVVLDWCTGQDTTHNQIIKILDDVAPFCRSAVDFVDVIYTDESKCTGTYQVPPPDIIYECSEYEYEISYKLRDASGQPFVNAINTNVRKNADGSFYIFGLPQDTSWIIYTVTDACNNVSQCFSEVYIRDNEAPNPVCEGYTVVSLEDQGWADIFAESIDDGSFDNCELDRFEIKRKTNPCGFPSDLQFGEKVNFCCEDVGEGYIKVVMRVWDKSGNYNDCVVNVTVQDKMNPTITCPGDVTIHCEQDYEDLTLTGGSAIAEDNCSAEVTHTDAVNLNDCGRGTVKRTWTAKDKQGRKATCMQIITVGDNDPFDGGDIHWPANEDVDACDASAVSPEALNSFPELFNTDCANIAISYKDDVFYAVPGYCVKVIRHWKVVDWCNSNPQNTIYYEYSQKIGIHNTVNPVITSSCANKTVTAELGECEVVLDETVEATDDCTPGALLKYSYTLDIDNNGSIDFSNTSKSITGTYATGTHRISWKVVDACGNIATCSYLITISDNKAPTPICLGSLVWVLNENGQAEVWASDFNLKSEDTCGDDDNLTFAFDEDGVNTSLSFSCDDVPNGIAAEIPLRMYVIDSEGDFEYCDVILKLQDSELTNACTDVLGSAGRIQGVVTTPDHRGLTDIEVELENMDAQSVDMKITDEGSYLFEEIAYYDDYSIAPTKTDDVKNGINTLDLVKIQRHILGLETLTDPYLLIAADINKNDAVSPADLLALRKVILGVSSTFPNNDSWRFVPTSYEFPDELDPFGFPEEIDVDEFYHNLTNADFVAVKIGDMDGTVEVADDNGRVANQNGTEISAIAPSFETGEIFTVDFRANELKEMLGLQFTLDFDTEALAFSTLSSGILEMDDSNLGLVQIADGHIAISWNDVNALSLNSDDILFTLSFKAKTAGDLSDYLAISSNVADAETYDGDAQTSTITLDISNSTKAISKVAENKLYQNSPNPFSTNTTIRFDLVEAGKATLTVYDITGAVITEESGDFEVGHNQFDISLDGKSINGVLYYRLESNNYQATRKMVVIK